MGFFGNLVRIGRRISGLQLLAEPVERFADGIDHEGTIRPLHHLANALVFQQSRDRSQLPSRIACFRRMIGAWRLFHFVQHEKKTDQDSCTIQQKQPRIAQITQIS